MVLHLLSTARVSPGALRPDPVSILLPLCYFKERCREKDLREEEETRVVFSLSGCPGVAAGSLRHKSMTVTKKEEESGGRQ